MISALKGMKDRYFDDIKKYDFIVNISKQVFSKYRFKKIITPILEESELFRRGVGDETDVVSKEMYNFKDKGDRDVTMRPEGTAGGHRRIAAHPARRQRGVLRSRRFRPGATHRQKPQGHPGGRHPPVLRAGGPPGHGSGRLHGHDR